MIRQELQVQPDPPNMLGFVHHQSAPIAHERPQLGQRLALEELAHGDVLAGDEERVRCAFAHVATNQRRLANAPRAVDHHHATR